MNDTPFRPPRCLSIVVPLLNEAESIAALHQRLEALSRRMWAAYGLQVGVVYVDDGSDDDSAAVIRSLPDDQLNVELIRLSRNFGKEAALLAGLDAAQGDAIVFMDADGQHPPELVDTFVRHWIEDGDDVVYAVRERREEGLVYRLAVWSFYRLLNAGSAIDIPRNAADFRLMSRRAATALRGLGERGRFFKGLSLWVGFRQRAVPYQPADRLAGTTKWPLWKLVRLSLSAMTGFSRMPLWLATVQGLVLLATALAGGGWIAVAGLLGATVSAHATLVVGLAFIGGLVLLGLGIIGEYVGDIRDEVRARPRYIVADHMTSTGWMAAPCAAAPRVVAGGAAGNVVSVRGR